MTVTLMGTNAGHYDSHRHQAIKTFSSRAHDQLIKIQNNCRNELLEIGIRNDLTYGQNSMKNIQKFNLIKEAQQFLK